MDIWVKFSTRSMLSRSVGIAISFFGLFLKYTVIYSLKVKVKVTQLCPTLCNPMDCCNRLLCPWNSPSKDTREGSHSLLQGTFPTQVLNPGLPHCRWDSSPAEPPGNTKNTGVGSLSLFLCIFQESNWDFLYCRQIPYQLSY